jgi:hypothetical protein
VSENYSKYEDAAWNDAMEAAAARCEALNVTASEFSYSDDLLQRAADEIRSMKRK